MYGEVKMLAKIETVSQLIMKENEVYLRPTIFILVLSSFVCLFFISRTALCSCVIHNYLIIC